MIAARGEAAPRPISIVVKPADFSHAVLVKNPSTEAATPAKPSRISVSPNSTPLPRYVIPTLGRKDPEPTPQATIPANVQPVLKNQPATPQTSPQETETPSSTRPTTHQELNEMLAPFLPQIGIPVPSNPPATPKQEPTSNLLVVRFNQQDTQATRLYGSLSVPHRYEPDQEPSTAPIDPSTGDPLHYRTPSQTPLPAPEITSTPKPDEQPSTPGQKDNDPSDTSGIGLRRPIITMAEKKSHVDPEVAEERDQKAQEQYGKPFKELTGSEKYGVQEQLSKEAEKAIEAELAPRRDQNPYEEPFDIKKFIGGKGA